MSPEYRCPTITIKKQSRDKMSQDGLKSKYNVYVVALFQKVIIYT